MSNRFSDAAEHDVLVAAFCRVAIYPPVRGWLGKRVQLEVSDSLETLGMTDAKTRAGYYLVWDGAEAARDEAVRLRGQAVELVYVQA